jgi:choline dehydrogenase-like flavoprotein
VASSWLLMRSGVARELPVGRRMSFNMGAPLTADFEQKLDSYDGLQISHYGVPSSNGFVFETWFNPPVSQALNMPGWFEQHFANMLRYDHLMAVGVLVGTESTGWLSRARTGGAGINFTPGAKDLGTLARGLRMLGEILFEAGATRVMLNTIGGDEIADTGELDRIQAIVTEPGRMALGTGHPQGGNALGVDPARSVVGPDFKVHGYEDLYVCDASVFPSSLTVNPQLTVMGLAHYAAGRIA